MYNTIHYFLKQSLNSSFWTGSLSSYSLRISYKGLNNKKLEYTTVFIKDNAKNVNYDKLTEEAINRLNNRRIALSSIKNLHMHLCIMS
jgi:hypothetical protein